MGKALKAIVVLIVSFCLGGCGTMGNVWCCCKSGEEKVYGGVANDLEALGNGARHICHPESPADAAFYALVLPLFFAVDLPLSLVGDTLTLPITIPATLAKWHTEGPPSDSNPQSRTDRLTAPAP
jgi:uncharacterized protein YceK